MKKIISILLVIVCVFSFVACAHSENPQNQVSDETFSGKYIMQNGVTDYVVVIPENADTYETLARNELVLLFNEATGVNLPVVTDTGKTFDENTKYISIGNTTLLKTSGITVPEEVNVVNGMALKTKGNTLFFIGGQKYGVVYAVYEFLFRTLNFEQFYTDCYSLDKCVTEIPLMDYNVIDYPDFPTYMGFPNFMWSNVLVGTRMKSPFNLGNTLAIVDGDYTHTSFLYMNKEVVKGHEEYWLSDDRLQLCYTAHGDQTELQLMLETYVGRVKETMKKNPGRSFYNLMHEDVMSACGCSACMESYNEYDGCNSAAYIKFVNKMADMIKDWMENDPEGQQYYDPNFRFMVGAYNLYEKPPTRYDSESKQYVPIKEDVIFRDNVMLAYAPIDANYQQSYLHEDNVVYYNNIKAWSTLANELYLFVYCTNFDNYMFPYDNYDSMQKNYQLFYDLNVKMLCDESQNGNRRGMTGFHILKNYLSCNYGWDKDANQNELIDRFFNGYFMDAAPHMLKFFNSYRNWSAYQENVLCEGIGGIYYRICNKAYWPKGLLEEWYGYVNDALLAIEKYKVNAPETYAMLYRHIVNERAFLDYALVELYRTELGSDLEFYISALEESVAVDGIQKRAEHQELDDYIASLKSK